MWTSVRVLKLGLSLHSSASKLCTLGQSFTLWLGLGGLWWLRRSFLVVRVMSLWLALNFRPILTPRTVGFLSKISVPLYLFWGLGRGASDSLSQA